MSALDAAAAAGRLVAERLLATDEVLPPILAAAPAERAAILARFAAARSAREAERLAAARAVRAALAPLIAGRAAGARLLAAAAAADAAHRLFARERRLIAERMIEAALGARR